MNPDSQALLGIAIAALGGAAVGVERQWSGKAGFAGIRTFTLLGLLGGLAGAFSSSGSVALAAVLIAGGVAITIAAYVAASKTDLDGTTEVAAMVVLAAGALSGSGAWRAGAGLTAATALLLAEKSTLHDFVGRISEPGLRAGFRFAVMALIVLPLLPEGPYGPLGGFRPQELWFLVLFFSGLSFAGYIARSAAGPRGFMLAGLIGGIISSTNVTFTFSRTSRTETAAQPALAVGVMGACTVLYFRVLTACAVLYAPLAQALLPYLLLPAGAGVALTLAGFWKARSTGEAGPPPQNPLQFGAAFQMAALFQVVMMVVYAMREQFGTAGVLTSAAVLGFTDMDALTISMVKSAQSGNELDLAAQAVALGIISNNVLKLAVVVTLGKGAFRIWMAVGLLALGSASAVALWLARH